MKKLTLLFAIALAAFLTSCSSEEEGTSLDFKDQPIQGMVEGEAWSMTHGLAVLSEDQDSNLIFDIDIYSATDQVNDVCDAWPSGNRIFFNVPNEIGVYNLSFNLNDFSGRTATIFHESTSMNSIASDGKIEILTVTETEITGRMAIQANADNYANGNFTLTLCSN